MSKYLNMTAEEKEAWIQDYINRRLQDGFEERTRRKRSDTGKIVSVGVQSNLRKRAKIKLAERIKRAQSASKAKALKELK